MANLKIKYIGTLIFLAMAASVALIWSVYVLIERVRTKRPDIPVDFQQVRTFCWYCMAITMVLVGIGV